MCKGDFTWSYGISTTNDRAGRATMVRLTKGTFPRNLIKFGGETVNFVN